MKRAPMSFAAIWASVLTLIAYSPFLVILSSFGQRFPNVSATILLLFVLTAPGSVAVRVLEGEGAHGSLADLLFGGLVNWLFYFAFLFTLAKLGASIRLRRATID